MKVILDNESPTHFAVGKMEVQPGDLVETLIGLKVERAKIGLVIEVHWSVQEPNIATPTATILWGDGRKTDEVHAMIRKIS